MAWQTIDNCPPETEVFGFCAYEDTMICGVSDPNKMPFVCMLVPSDGEYDTHWVSFDAYGDILDGDCHAPTHWMPIETLPSLPTESDIGAGDGL